MVRPASRGRQKIEIKKIERKTSLGVTFTKRRDGLFRKANELVTLCAVQMAMIIFSPSKKVYCFGHPDVYAVIDRFLHLIRNTQDPVADKFMEEYRKSKINDLYSQLNEIRSQIEIEKKKAKELASQVGNAADMSSRDQMSYHQILRLQAKMQKLKGRFSTAAHARLVESVNATNFGAPGPSNIPGPNYGPSNFLGPNHGPWNF